MRQLKFVSVAVLLLVAAIGCSDDSPTEPIIEEPEPVPTVTDTFMGTFGLGETSCHVFTTTLAGPAELRVTALAPLDTLTIGLGIGLDDGDDATECSYIAVDNSVRLGDPLVSQLTGATDYCVCIFDVGNVFPDQTVSYTFTVEHP